MSLGHLTGVPQEYHHPTGGLQVFPRVLMAPSQRIHKDPSTIQSWGPVWAKAVVVLPPCEGELWPLSETECSLYLSIGSSPEAETAPGSPVTQRVPSPLESRKQG